MPITFYNECEALQLPSGNNGADGLSAVSQVKDSTTTIPQIDPINLYPNGTLYASAVGAYGYEWLQVGVFFTLPQYGTFEVVSVSAATATEVLIGYKNRGADGNEPQGTVVPVGTLIIPAGSPGQPGTNGSSVLSGTVAPISSNGANGDFFINTATSTIYGPKASGAWPAGVSLIGPAGPTGTGVSITNNANTGSASTGISGTFTLHSITLAANALCANNGDFSVFHCLVQSSGTTALRSTPPSRGRLFVNANGTAITANTTLQITDPLGYIVSQSPLGGGGLPVNNMVLRVYIQRLTNTTALVSVAFTDSSQGTQKWYRSTATAITFTSSITLALGAEFISDNPSNSAIQANMVTSWVEKYTA